MNKKIIEINHVSKKYRIGHRETYLSLRDKISEVVSIPGLLLNKLNGLQQTTDQEIYWALKNINFTINQGEAIGLIGPNGAGKSTLLKILSHITPPSEGEIILRGRVASLLEVGTGFHQELTGRENIYLNGAILGMKRKEINNKFKDIVEFSEVEKFLDTPVKHYSSGMYMRLAFSVAAHLDPEILLVDEVLAVGDTSFQKKCLGRMGAISNEGKTLIFVSHNMSSIQNLCQKAVLLWQGKVIKVGKTDQVVGEYLKLSSNLSSTSLAKRLDRKGLGETRFTKIVLNRSKSVISGNYLEMKIDYASKGLAELKNCRLGITFKDSYNQFLFLCASETSQLNKVNLSANGQLICSIDKLPLSEGEYNLDLFMEVNGDIQDWIENAVLLKVSPGNFHPGIRQYPYGFEGKGVLVSNRWILS